MKTIVNKLRFALLLGLMAMSVTAWSQAVPYVNKMSITTQMFLDEMAGRLTFDEEAAAPPKYTTPGARELPVPRRPIVDPDTIGGTVYISSFVRVTDDSVIGELEGLGVQVQTQFKNGLLTANIPVGAIEQVAALEGVTRIEVSSVMRPLTNLARTASNVDDLLTLSNDARNAGLLQMYDGSGVILGIIDSGIDFQHKAFQDKNGNTRVKGAYCYNGSSVTADWTGTGTLPTTDNTSSDHGTHTSSIAGGSSVTVSGTTVTVTDDHASATYGGMAPGADLYLAGTRLATTHILNAFQRMCDYADAEGKPLVVNNSWGSSWGPRDGSNDVAEVISQLFGPAYPNRICLFASSNDAGHANGGVGGGLYATGQSTQASPLGTILRTESYIEGYGYPYYTGVLASAWTRANDADGIGANIYVINKTSGVIQYTYNIESTNSNSGTSYNSLTLGGFNKTIAVYFDYSPSDGKHQVMLYTGSYFTSGSNYAIALEVYPIGGSDNTIDIWGGDYTYLTGNVTTEGHTWVYGTDDMSVDDEATMSEVITVGSYVTRTRSGSNSVGDISDFSSYAVEGMGPLGDMHPWITAPGEDLISAYNHNVSHSSSDLVVNNSSSPYGLMSGTSMATPAASGIVALWMQAATEKGKTLSLPEVKNIMKETAIRDNYVTSGSNASHFGNGKIDALAGVQYILENDTYSDPMIAASSTDVQINTQPNEAKTQTINVVGISLTEGITMTINDPSNVFTVALGSVAGLGASGTQEISSTGGKLNITYSPRAVGSHTGTITLTSNGAETVTIALNGNAALVAEATVCDGSATNEYLPVYGYWYDQAQTNQMLYPADKLAAEGMTDGQKVTALSFFPTTSGSTSGINFYYNNGGTVTVKLANMPASTSRYTSSSPARKDADFTTVKTITMPGSAQTGLTEWAFENLEDEFIYTGGDLLIEVVTTAGRYGRTYFAGESFDNSYPGYYSYGSSSAGQPFLPKVKFTLEREDTTPTVEVPVIEPEDGTTFNTAPQQVTITCPTDGATIYYSTDGGNTYNVYNGPFDISANTTVMARATAADMEDSPIATATYTFQPQAPVITPATGNLINGQEVTITCPTDGATIYYSTDGGNTYQAYTGPFTMSGDGTVTAYATMPGWDNSEAISATYTIVYPSLTVNPASVLIEDETGDARTSETITVTSEYLSGSYSTSASINWTAAMLRSDASMTMTYGGKALHQYGAGSVSQGGLTAGVSSEYLYTGPIYVIGDVNGYAWNTDYGVQLTRDDDGFYTGTITTQASSDAAYILFTKRLGSDTDYRFGPVSNGNWWLTSELEDVYAPIDTVGNLNNIRLAAGTWFVTIDSRGNQFKIRPAVTASSVTPAAGSLDFGSAVSGSGTTTQSITITNTGETTYTPTVSASGAYTTDYVPTALAPGESVTVTVTFAPQADGIYTEPLVVTAGNDTYQYTLNGTGYTPSGPVVSGYVETEDQNIDYGEKAVGSRTRDYVTIVNNGDVAFTPVLDLSGLEGTPFTVTGNGEVAAGENLALSVFFTPTEEGGPYTATFTVTIGEETYTVTLTGSATAEGVASNFMRTNTVTVPVYKTDIAVHAPYSYSEIEGDTQRQLAAGVTNGAVSIETKRPAAIMAYHLYKSTPAKNNSYDDVNWAPGEQDQTVAYAYHDAVSASYLPYEKPAGSNSYVQSVVVADTLTTGANMWLKVNNNVTTTGQDIWYVPVTVATSKLKNINTYGARIEASPIGEVGIETEYDETSHHRDSAFYDDATQMYYTYITAQARVTSIPPAYVLDTVEYECAKVRIWRQYTPYVPGVGNVTPVDEIVYERNMSELGEQLDIYGSKDWTEVNNDSIYQPNSYTICIQSGTDQSVRFIARFYYKRRVITSQPAGLRVPTDYGTSSPSGNEYYVVEDAQSLSGTPTHVHELTGRDREVVGVMYVNPLGMTSDQPFEGVNIIVTRYSDGSTSTTKVLRD